MVSCLKRVNSPKASFSFEKKATILEESSVIDQKIVPSFFSGILFEKTSNTFLQLFRYLFIGGISAFFDMFVFFIFSSILNTHYLIAQTFGFLVGITLNYFLSIKWIFESKYEKITERSLFFLTGGIGLLVSYFFLWLFIDVFNITAFDNLVAKILTSSLTLLWNFGSRKLFVFKRG